MPQPPLILFVQLLAFLCMLSLLWTVARIHKGQVWIYTGGVAAVLFALVVGVLLLVG